MNSELPLSTAGDGASTSSAAVKTSTGSSIKRSSSWLDIIKKVYEILKKLIPLIKNCFNMSGSSSSSASDTAKSTKDILSQLTNILPTGTFMAFQLIAPLATNSGNCGSTEKIVTGALLGVFAAMIAISTFTDSVKIPSTGKVYYGLVTTKGLWNPAFKGTGVPGVTGSYYSSGGDKYKMRGFDFVNAAISLAAFAALSLLTDPVKKCYFKSLSSTVEKSVPLIVGVVISFLLSFAPAARNGIGYRVDATVHSNATHSSLLHHDEPVRSTVGP
ncbi:hypothetical protein M758_1G045900 [Ceratodon purpureus]|uniref:Uncharacterized protein n=1 Tax=Ceratodon purpureus TaxID=3225 RepID=A0A8T0J4G6_CERPU|nr:hypothetical protein KC19_1G048500 [Ceratodon purpureus]KAG0589797.1 hypothetical protein KC19_1G048500 [Ceratodon purpureus]KAG0589798.1 hypothetical protein KC19_1G048500 [Ceratodon purpureus]KAG0628699.1 hypothetical protein M758_1G045900 [Ceratodon purpureus]KAG0628700.1 hypothetical protein M758_1G045900 [Ceratodon purpureus]